MLSHAPLISLMTVGTYKVFLAQLALGHGVLVPLQALQLDCPLEA